MLHSKDDVILKILIDGPIIPLVDPDSFRYSLPYPLDLLESLVEVGILEKETVDTIQVCPMCAGILTYRKGCPYCGFGVIIYDKMLRHFACGYVGLIRDFETDGKLKCPKCRVSKLSIGVDYDLPQGAARCLSCGWTGTEPTLISHCLSCDIRFPASEAFTTEINKYYLKNSDSLDILSTR